MREQQPQREGEAQVRRADDVQGEELDEDSEADRTRATANAHHDIARTAGAGVAGAAQPLPHLTAIQRSFGDHDVSSVRAQVGGPAATAAAAIGAEAYATGDRVAFGAAPDLHTAAHEAAHVVQNRAGGDMPRAAGGALTSRGDAHESHADAVADRVVRGESAAALLDVAPAGGAIARKPAVQAPDSPAAAMTELRGQLDGGITNPARIPVLVAMLSWADQTWVREHKLADIEAACTASQVIEIFEVLGEPPLEVIKVALRKNASATELAGIIGRLEQSDLVELAADAATFAAVRAALPGSPTLYTRRLQFAVPEVGQSGPLLRWFVENSSPQQICRMISSTPGAASLVPTFEQENLWGWVPRVSAAGMTWFDEISLRSFADAAPDHIKPALLALADAAPKPLPGLVGNPSQAEYDAAAKASAAESSAAATQLVAKLRGSKPVSATELLELAGKASYGGKSIGKDPAARRRVLATLDLEQVATFVNVLQMDTPDRIDWLLDVNGVNASIVIEVISTFSDVATVFADATRTRRLHKLLGDNLALLETLGGSEKLQQLAFRNAELRTWLLGKATPGDLLRFVTMGDNADSIAAACTVVAKDHGYGWVYELSGDGGAERLRRLALGCPDRAAAAHLSKFGIHDFELAKGNIIAGSQALPNDVYHTPAEQLRADVASGDGGQIAAEAAEMSDADRAVARKDQALVGKAIHGSAASSNAGFDAVRTARELNSSLPDTVRAIGDDAWSVNHSAFRTYARERPATEQIAVASDPELARRAETLLHYGPLNALPALREPAALAGGLKANPALLGWIERTTSPVEAITLLGATPAVASAAAAAFEVVGVGLIKALPHHGLTVTQRLALTRIGGDATQSALHIAVADRLEDNAASDPAKGPSDKLDGGKPLGAVLDDLKRANAGAPEVQAACNAHPHAEALEVLADSSNPQRLDYVRQLQVSPLTVFPWLTGQPLASYASFPVVDWLLATEEPVALLRMIAGAPKVIALVGVHIDARHAGALHWLTNLPGGYGLADGDEATLHAVYASVTSDAGAKDVFQARFGHLPQGEWSRAALDKMWVTLARLPDRQIEANHSLGGFQKGATDGPLAGSYTPGTGVVTLSSEGGQEDRYQHTTWQSKSQLAAQLGVDEAEIDRRVNARLVETEQQKGTTVYRVKPVSGDNFTYTLLHEVGHSVDALLGGRTELVYGMAGWRSYSGGDFDAWADDMNAWAGASVTSEDKADIRMLFEQRLQSSSAIEAPASAVADLAPKTHAIKSDRNKNAFIAKAVKSKSNAFEYRAPIEHNGRMFLMNHHYGRWMSYDAKIHDILPLPYAGFAPEEFFAECYVEYYRDESTPGGNLPGWIKTWFDANVQRVGHGPVKP